MCECNATGWELLVADGMLVCGMMADICQFLCTQLFYDINIEIRACFHSLVGIYKKQRS